MEVVGKCGMSWKARGSASLTDCWEASRRGLGGASLARRLTVGTEPLVAADPGPAASTQSTVSYA
jgi:hypothetical protein